MGLKKLKLKGTSLKMKGIKILIHIGFAIVLLFPTGTQAEKQEEEFRKFDSEKIHALKRSGDYDYEVSQPEKADDSPSIFSDLLRKLFNFSSAEGSDSVWRGIAILIAIIFVGFILARLTNADKSWFISSRNKKIGGTSFMDSIENIEDPDFHSLISEAIKNREFKLAIRYFYLQMLQDLNHYGMIKWEAAKTNSDYSDEIKSEGIKERFSRSALIYEYIWYGDFELNESVFDSARESFELFEKSLSKS